MPPLPFNETVVIVGTENAAVEVGQKILEDDLEAGQPPPRGAAKQGIPEKLKSTSLSKGRQDPAGTAMQKPSPMARHNRKDPSGFLMREGDMLDRVFEGVESTVCRTGQKDHNRLGVHPRSHFHFKSTTQKSGGSRSADDRNPNSESPRSEETEERDKSYIPSGTVVPLRSILKKHSFDEEKKEKNSTNAGTSQNAPFAGSHTKESNKDTLDCIFGNTESLLFCRSKKNLDSLRDIPSLMSPDDNSLINDSGTEDSSSPIRLHRLAGEGDTMDSDFDDLETAICEEPTSSLPETPTTAGSQQLSMDSSLLNHQNDGRAAIYLSSRPQSLLDAASSEDDNNYKLKMLKLKKRQIEERIRSNSTEPGILVPRGYKEKAIPSNIMSLSQSVSQQEERSKFRKYLLVGIVSFLLAAAMILVGVSFFWPTEKL